MVGKIDRYRAAYLEHPSILQIIDEFKETFLFEGAEEYFRKLVPRDSEIVLAHNDAQENNILASLHDLTNVIFIDFEYTSWNPRAMDLANYINETIVDNAHPVDNGIKYYLRNMMKDEEQEFMIKRYLSHYFNNYFPGRKEGDDEEAFIKEEYPKLLEETHRCLLLNSYFWAIWALHMIKEEKLGDPTVFNFDYAQARIAMYNHTKKLYFS